MSLTKIELFTAGEIEPVISLTFNNRTLEHERRVVEGMRKTAMRKAIENNVSVELHVNGSLHLAITPSQARRKV